MFILFVVNIIAITSTCLFYCHINYFTFSHHFASDVSFGIIKHLLTSYIYIRGIVSLLTLRYQLLPSASPRAINSIEGSINASPRAIDGIEGSINLLFSSYPVNKYILSNKINNKPTVY